MYFLRLLLQIKIEICTMMLINHPNVVQLYEVHLHTPNFSLRVSVFSGVEANLLKKFDIILGSGEQDEDIYCPRVHQWWKAF